MPAQKLAILTGLLLAGGVIGPLFIHPRTDRRRLAAHVSTRPLQPAGI